MHKYIYTLLLALLCSCYSYTQYITTIAGNGMSACFQDNTQASCTPFSYPSHICIAPNGDIYIPCGNSLKKISASTGIVSRIAGSDTPGSTGDGGPAINALMQFARAVRLDAVGNIYILELSGNRVRKITAATGIISTVAGNGIAGYSGDGGPAVNAMINNPWDLRIDNNGNIYIADFYNSRIRKVNATTGIITTVVGTGSNTHSGDGGPALNAGIPYPNSIYIDQADNIYISECFSNQTNRIRKVNATTGIITTIAGNNNRMHGGDGGLATNATLIEPTGVLVDPNGNIYISEYVGSRVRRIDASSGIITTVVGNGIEGFSGDGGLAKNAVLHYPIGLSMDINGDLYICDSDNLRVRKVFMTATSPPVITPTIVISANTTSLCAGNSIAFTATISNSGLNPVYQWKKNGVNVGTNSATYNGTGLVNNDIITCTLTSTLCTSQSTVTSNLITLTGGSSGPISITVTASFTSICTGQNVVFSAESANAGLNPSFQWKLNGTNVGANSSIYNNSGLINGDVVNCVLTADPSFPCSSNPTIVSNNINITVSTGISPTISIVSSDNNICPGNTVTFSATVQNAGTSPICQWKLNGNNIGNNSTIFTSNNLTNNDEIVCVTTPNNSCSTAPIASNIIKMAIKAIPSISITPLDTIVTKGSQVLLKAAISGTISGYTWSPTTSLTNSFTLTPLTFPLQSETEYTLTILTTENCTVSAKSVIKIQQKFLMPTGFTPNNDGLNDVFRIPQNVLLNLKEFAIYDRWGNKIFATSDINKGWDGNFKNLKKDSGVYLYVIEGYEDNKVAILKGTFTLIR